MDILCKTNNFSLTFDSGLEYNKFILNYYGYRHKILTVHYLKKLIFFMYSCLTTKV